ncbi:hypothetical protein [Micromonospora sp. NPDC005979]|uniref:hypothetical protein n=1 Tax=Micromonospora sp. NPDC005979 TaxID=3156726 RepID=UPI0033A61316
MSEEYRQDVAEAVGRMGSAIGATKELRDVESHLGPDERVIALVAGNHGPGNGLLVLTQARLFFLFEGIIRESFLEVPIAEVAGVEWQTGINLGTITIHAGSAIEVSGVDKDGGEVLVSALKETRATYSAR